MKKGISLIILVITIIVMIIIAAAIIISMTDANTIEMAEKAKNKTTITNFKQELDMYISEQTLQNKDYDKSSLNATSYDDVKEIIKSMDIKYADKLIIQEGTLVAQDSYLTESDISNLQGLVPIISTAKPLLEILEGKENEGQGLYVDYRDENNNRYNTNFVEADGIANSELGWQILDVLEDAQGVKYVKLISSIRTFKITWSGATSATVVKKLTDPTYATFDVRLTAYKNANLATKVISITKNDADLVKGSSIAEGGVVPAGPLRINATYALATGNGSYYICAVNSSNALNIRTTGGTIAVRPIVYLKPEVLVNSGTGTQEDPYVIGI